MRNSDAPRDSTVQSVDRAVSVLQVLARERSAGVTAIAKEMGVHKSTVFRVLVTLESRGLVEQDLDRGKYRLGYTLVQLAAGATKALDVSIQSRPICQELALAAGETVNVCVLDGHDVLTIDQVIGSATISSVDWVGKRTPMHATAAGKLLLALSDAAVRAGIINRGLARYTANTVVDPTVLTAELNQIAQQGFAISAEEHETGLVAVGAPIRSLDGKVEAALTLSGPSYRLTQEALPQLTKLVVAAGIKASWRLGSLKVG